MMAEETLLVERKEHYATLVVNRPEKRNTVDQDSLIKIYQVLNDFSQDDDIRAIIFRGAGEKAFCAGYDIAAIPTGVPPEMTRQSKDQDPVVLALNTVEDYPYPTIAMMNGFTFGAGFHLAMCCDIRIAVDDVRMGMPPSKLGVVYHAEGLRQLVEAMGLSRTKEVLLTGRTYQGAQAREMGLVDYLVPRPELEAFTYGLAEEIAGNAPLSLKAHKKMINTLARSLAFSPADLEEFEALRAQAFNSEDLKEGQLAFMEKRKPRFTGR